MIRAYLWNISSKKQTDAKKPVDKCDTAHYIIIL